MIPLTAPTPVAHHRGRGGLVRQPLGGPRRAHDVDYPQCGARSTSTAPPLAGVDRRPAGGPSDSGPPRALDRARSPRPSPAATGHPCRASSPISERDVAARGAPSRAGHDQPRRCALDSFAGRALPARAFIRASGRVRGSAARGWLSRLRFGSGSGEGVCRRVPGGRERIFRGEDRFPGSWRIPQQCRGSVRECYALMSATLTALEGFT